MTDVLLVRYEIAAGETERVREWLAEAGAEHDRVAELLRAEGMLTESLFVEEREDGDYLLLYQEAADIGRVLEVFEAGDADLVAGSRALLEEGRALFEEAIVGGLERPVEVIEPALHATNPER